MLKNKPRRLRSNDVSNKPDDSRRLSAKLRLNVRLRPSAKPKSKLSNKPMLNARQKPNVKLRSKLSVRLRPSSKQRPNGRLNSSVYESRLSRSKRLSA